MQVLWVEKDEGSRGEICGLKMQVKVSKGRLKEEKAAELASRPCKAVGCLLQA